jgi:hypothetical protein
MPRETTGPAVRAHFGFAQGRLYRYTIYFDVHIDFQIESSLDLQRQHRGAGGAGAQS